MNSRWYLRHSILFLLLFAFPHTRANKDSLLNVLKTAKDTLRVQLLLKISSYDLSEGNVEESERKITEAKNLSGEMRDTVHLSRAILREIYLYYYKGQFRDGLKICNQLLPILQRKKYKNMEGECVLYKGMFTGRLGDFKGALDQYHLILPYFEKNPNGTILFRLYTCVAGVYYDQLDYNMAIEYFKKALDHSIKTNNISNVAQCYNNIGAALGNQGKSIEAKEYYLKALPINIKLNNKGSLAYIYMNIAAIELQEKDLPDAVEYNQKAMAIFRELNEPYSIVDGLTIEADILVAMGRTKEALVVLEEAVALSEKTGSPLLMEKTYKTMGDVYERVGNYKSALLYKNKYLKTKEAIVNENIREEVTKKKLAYEFEKQKLADSLESAGKQKYLSEQLEHSNQRASLQRNISIVSFGSLLIVGVLAFFLYRGAKKNKTASRIIEKQKKEVELKNKEITDSMHYAKKIQNTLMAQTGIINACFPQNFILFKPKDIVSGDFYWAVEKNDHFFLTVGDSTGHGVPGAFMSLLNMGFLSEAVKEKNITQPNEIFNYARQKLLDSFGTDAQRDGMDGIIISVNMKTKQMAYAAANNAPVLIRNGRIGELAYDKMPVGRGERTDSFKLYELDLQSGDSLYLYTDGYADQFGGEKGKKYKYKKLNQKLLSIRSLDVQNQKEDLNSEFDHWKGSLEQVDDVCLVGLKF